MPVLINKKTGKTTRFSDAKADQLLREGDWKVRPGDTVQFVEQGELRTVGAEQAEKALRSGSGVLASEEGVKAIRDAERREADLEKRFGGFSPLAILEAGAAGATFRGSDVLLKMLGRDQFEAQQLRQRAPGTTLAEITGAVAPALLTGGTSAAASGGSLAARAARLLPAGAAARVNLGIARGVGGLASTGARGTAARVAGIGLGSAAEGALIGGGVALSNELLKDDPFASEAALAEIGSDALFGAALGGAAGGLIGGTGEVFSLAAKGIRSATGVVARQAERKIEDRVIKRLTKGGGATLDDVIDESVELSLASRLKATDRVSDTLEREAKALSSIDDDIAGQLRSFKTARRDFDNAFKADDDVVERMLRTSPNEVAGVARQLSDEAVRLDELIRAQRAIDAPPVSSIEEIAGIQGSLADDILRGEATLVDTASGQVVDRLRQHGPGLLRNASFLAGSLNFAGATRNRALGLANATGIVSKASKIAGGGSLAELVQSFAEKAAIGIERFGASRGRVASGTARGAAAVFNATRFGPPPPEGVKLEAVNPSNAINAYLARRRELEAAMAAPDNTMKFIKLALAHLNTPPEVAHQMAMGQFNKLRFLHSKLPRAVPLGNAVLGMRLGVPGPGEINKFARLVQAAENPLSILDSIQKGTLSKDEVEAVKELYPNVFRTLQLGVLSRVEELQGKLTYKQRLQMSALYEVPVDTIMQPKMLAALQPPKQEEKGPLSPQQATGQRGGKMNLGKIKPPDMTGAQSQIARG